MNEKTEPQNVRAHGVLHAEKALENFELQQFAAPDALGDVVSGFWSVRWDLPKGEQFENVNLPFPVQHIVLDPQCGSGLFGCTRGCFTYVLQGRGAVLGARLHPGAACGVFGGSVEGLTDSSVPLSQILTTDIEPLETNLWAEPTPKSAVDALAHAIQSVLRPLPAQSLEARHAVELVAGNRDITRAGHLASLLNMDLRRLQRLFGQYVGVSPKWVIDRYRMFEALDALHASQHVDLAALAAQLEYTDQAHFSTQFKKLTGTSPAAYVKMQK